MGTFETSTHVFCYTHQSMCDVSVSPPRPGLSLLSYPFSRLSRIFVKVAISLELRVVLDTACDLNLKKKHIIKGTQRKREAVYQLQK